MNEFLKMDIFFFVTTLAVVILTTLTIFAFYKLNTVLKDIAHVVKQVSAETDSVREDLADFRRDIRQGTGRVKAFLKFFSPKQKRLQKKS